MTLTPSRPGSGGETHALPAGALLDTIGFLWESPFPTALQGSDFRIVDVNAAFAELLGHTREQLRGRDVIEYQPREDWPTIHAARERLRTNPSLRVEPSMVEGRFIDAQGRERRYRVACHAFLDDDGARLYLAVMQDVTAEYAAREHADRSLRELDDWFDLSPVGMLLFDEAGAVLRSNPVFAALAGAVPASLAGAAPEVQVLLGWAEAGSLAGLDAGAAPVQRLGWVASGSAAARPLRASVRCYFTAGGRRRYMAVVEDRSVEEQRDLARQRTEELLQELSTILESSSAGIAYFRDNRLVRCNRRFEAILGVAPGAMTSGSIERLFGTHEDAERIAAEALVAVRDGSIYETELAARVDHAGELQTRWYSLSVRRIGPMAGAIEAIAVLADVTRLKAQQQELERLARDRELMFSLSGVGIAFLRDGRVERANQALAHLTAYSVDELTALSLADLYADADEFMQRWPHEERSLREHGRWTGERPLRARDGRLLWVQVSKRLVVEGDPAGGIIASYVNVDSRYRAERAVALQADRTRAILDSVLVGIVTVGPQGIEWMNRSARRMFGGDLADFVNLPIATVATPEPEHPFQRTEYLTELVEGQAETFECRVKARDGREFWVVGNVVSTARESTGRQLTYALLDIERRRQAEARVSQAQAQLQRIIEAAPLAITLRDATTLTVLQVNEVAAGIKRRTRAELIGRTPEQIFDADTAAQRRRDMEQALASPEVTKREYHAERDGETRIWDARYLPLATHPGAPPDQLLLVATDVTEQRAAQEARLEAAIAQREMLVKEVHHRIKNNLQGVAGLLQQIAQRKPEVAGPIAEIVGQVQAIAQVYGLQVGQSGPLQLVGVVQAITASVQRTFGRAIRFTVTGATANEWLLPETEAIPIALTLNELLTNAVKHSAASVHTGVECTLACGDAQVQVQIANHALLPAGFALARIPGGVSGLGLVRSLLPRRSASLALEQHGAQVVATVVLSAPGVARSGSA